jgi:hypothetical protein
MYGGDSESQGGWRALIYAAEYGHTGCARLLIDAGADKEAKNNVRRRSLLCFGHFVLYVSKIVSKIPMARTRFLLNP